MKFQTGSVFPGLFFFWGILDLLCRQSSSGFVSLMKQKNSTNLSEKQEQNFAKRFVEPPTELPKNVSKIGFDERLFYFLERQAGTFQQLPPEQQKRFTERFSITICVGIACVLSSFFYWFLPPLVRVAVVPVFIGAAWWFGAKVLVKFVRYLDLRQEIKVPQLSNAVELLQLLNAIKFSAVTFSIAAIPFFVMPVQYQAALDNADARTLFLGLFIWNLIGAPLFAQARDRRSRLIIALVFAVPVIIATTWWVSTNPFF